MAKTTITFSEERKEEKELLEWLNSRGENLAGTIKRELMARMESIEMIDKLYYIASKAEHLLPLVQGKMDPTETEEPETMA